MGLPLPSFAISLSSAIFFLGVHVLARRQPDPLGFLVLLFPILIINMPMSGIRQGAAIGLLCIAFVAFIDRRPYGSRSGLCWPPGSIRARWYSCCSCPLQWGATPETA